MVQEKYDRLTLRNNKIINAIMNEINNVCPNSIDLIGITGSFSNGNIHKSSDLNLLIIRNDNDAKCLDKNFIFEGVGFNICTRDWNYLEQISKYKDIYLSDLMNLEIIYSKNENILKKYKTLQNTLLCNINNKFNAREYISYYFSNILGFYDVINRTNDLGVAYRCLAKIIFNTEKIIYMLNNSYVKGSVIDMKKELYNMNILPSNFINVYDDITNCNCIGQVKSKAFLLIKVIEELIDKLNIKYSINKIKMNKNKRTKITSNNLIGTYELLVSKYKNKMYIAEINKDKYLAFKIMASCQDFYDDMYRKFYISNQKLIDSYTPDYLFANSNYFNESLLEWYYLCNKYGVEIEYYFKLNDLDRIYLKRHDRFN